MAAQLYCSFSSHTNGTCDFSARFPGKNEFFPLSSHLRQLKVAQTSVRHDSVSEASHCAKNLVENKSQILPSSAWKTRKRRKP